MMERGGVAMLCEAVVGKCEMESEPLSISK